MNVSEKEITSELIRDLYKINKAAFLPLENYIRKEQNKLIAEKIMPEILGYFENIDVQLEVIKSKILGTHPQ